MHIGDFNDFANSISPEAVEAICNDANMKVQQMREDSNPKNRTYFGNQLFMLSYTVSIELLGLYHKWLEEQL